ncbi:ornithine carbamoyltransferase [Bacillus alkalicellulosilyticus]|uniref:ornithine carbamoyltransferase n=1 Tax=Alkalihalobacterium alkalicellulosilyticum TaxID=1912214 RepID=UPI000996BFAF|nr:ornithine carbamoyltransferase [Bacillus alkalicellulosilyticus]
MNLLSIDDMSERQVNEIFTLATKIKNQNTSHVLKGKHFVLFFPESSLRTRITFEKGIKDLGGETTLFPPETLDKREELKDVIQYLSNWSDGVIIRHADFSKLQDISTYSNIPIINAMTSESHPCEILSDLYSISQVRENYKDLVFTFVGPKSNISRTWKSIAEIMDLRFHQVCMQGFELGTDSRNYSFHTELEPILKISDIVLTDSLPNELRTQIYIDQFQITLERMNLAKEHAMLNPCPPFYRNEEVSNEALSSSYFVGYEFKKNLIYVQQAIILFCLGIVID